MHIEDLFTPAQQALVAGLHRRDQQECQAGSTDRLDETADWLTYILPLEKSHLIAVKLA